MYQEITYKPLQSHINPNQQIFMAQLPHLIQLTLKMLFMVSKLPLQFILHQLMYPLPESTLISTMPHHTITHHLNKLLEKPPKSLLEENHTLKSTHQSNKPLMFNLLQLMKPTDSQRKSKPLLLNLSEKKQDMNKELNQLEQSLSKSTPAAYQLQLLKEERRLRKEDVHHGFGFCWVF